MSGPASASSSSTPTQTTAPLLPVENPPLPPPAQAPPPPYIPPKPATPVNPPKPILKRPKPPPQPFFNFTRNFLSIGSKFLPPQQNQQQPNAGGAQNAPINPSPDVDKTPASPSPLKRAHFIVNHMSTTYPISSQAPPSMPGLTDAIREIEELEFERRQRESDQSSLTLQRVEELYRECCRSRDEPALLGVVGALRQANNVAPRILDLTGVRLIGHAALPLADALAVEWGLRKLILKDCDLEDLGLKPILHSLLITQSLPYLSLASNRRFKSSSFNLIGVFAQKSNTLEFLDLSQISLDKRSVDCIVIALRPAQDSHDANGPGTSSSSIGSSTPPLAERATASYFQQQGRAYSMVGVGGALPPIPQEGSAPTGAPSMQLSLSTLTEGQQVNGRRLGPTDSDKHSLAESVTVGSPVAASSSPPSPAMSFASLAHSPSPYDRRRPRQGSVISLSGLGPPPPTQLLSLRLDECSLRGSSLETLAQAVRTSSLRHLSLRQNRIGPQGSVALALMMKDYPDSVPVSAAPANLVPPGASQQQSATLQIHSPISSGGSSPFTRQGGSGASTPLASSRSSSPSPLPSQPPPPPRHPTSVQATAPHQTTYTPYIPRSKRNMVVSQPVSTTPPPQSEPQRQVPVITSSRAGGVTSARPPTQPTSTPTNRPVAGSQANMGRQSAGLGINMMNSSTALSRREETVKLEGHSAALLNKVRSLDSLPRLGALQTLDLRGNEIKNGVSYIAQVLKRNRTLKVLNLADNRIEVMGLVTIADALKYNSTLETLDMSRNPCCGPGLEGITSIRTAFTLNISLKRLFLSGTGLTPSGAICLAEFLPEARSLLHLDLTQNTLDIAGVMALNVGLKMNETIRCLDVNVPPNDAEFSRLSREILRWCVRNTERAVAGSGGTSTPGHLTNGSNSLNDVLGLTGGSRGGIWGLIEKSELAKVVKEEAERERLGLEKKERGSVSGREKLDVWKKTPAEVVRAAKDCTEDLQLLIGGILPSDNGHKERLVERAQVLVTVIGEMVLVEENSETLNELLALNDELLELIKRVRQATEASLTISLPVVDDGSPRFDYKGKGKATPQDELPPEEPQYPAVIDTMLEVGAEEKERNGSVNSMPSPVERSRLWVVEEGEVFRKGQVLLGPNLGEEDAEVTGDELRLELLEAQVERPRHRLIDQEDGEDDDDRRVDFAGDPVRPPR